VFNHRFHAYSVANEYEDSFDSFTKSMEIDSTSQPQGRGRGDGMPSLKLGVGVREDVITLWEELDEARNTLAEIQALLCEMKDPKETPGEIFSCGNGLLSVIKQQQQQQQNRGLINFASLPLCSCQFP